VGRSDIDRRTFCIYEWDYLFRIPSVKKVYEVENLVVSNSDRNDRNKTIRYRNYLRTEK
jgi:hypothetical protein